MVRRGERVAVLVFWRFGGLLTVTILPRLMVGRGERVAIRVLWRFGRLVAVLPLLVVAMLPLPMVRRREGIAVFVLGRFRRTLRIMLRGTLRVALLMVRGGLELSEANAGTAPISAKPTAPAITIFLYMVIILSDVMLTF